MVRIFQAEDLVVRVGLEMYCSFMNFRKGCTYPPVHTTQCDFERLICSGYLS